jgi:hypothetical protein
MKETIVVSFSGGKTSAYMAVKLIELWGHVYNFVFIFSNTGLEDEETLIFVDRCDVEFGLNVVWVEAVVNPIHGKGITHRAVSFKTASRNGEPFEAHIAKSGIPNANKPQCSDRLKALAIEHYKKTNKLTGVRHCIGMRSDELNRVFSARKRKDLREYGLSDDQVNEFAVSNDANKEIIMELNSFPDIKSIRNKYKSGYNLIYPLASDHFGMKCDKLDVNIFWEMQSFTLNLEEHQGNCMTCWKKSDKKLWLIALESPEKFDFMRRMEKKYKDVKPNDDGKPRVFFRKHRSVEDIFKESEMLDEYTLRKMIGANTDQDSGCSESCDSYGHE